MHDGRTCCWIAMVMVMVLNHRPPAVLRDISAVTLHKDSALRQHVIWATRYAIRGQMAYRSGSTRHAFQGIVYHLAAMSPGPAKFSALSAEPRQHIALHPPEASSQPSVCWTMRAGHARHQQRTTSKTRKPMYALLLHCEKLDG